MTTKQVFYVMAVVMAVFSVAGDWLLVLHTRKHDYRCLVGGFVFCNLAILCFLQVLYLRTLFEASISFDVLTTMTLVALSILILKEKVPVEAFFWGVAAIMCVYMMQRYMPD